MFKDMTDEALVEAYWGVRNALANAGNLGAAATTRHGRRVAARHTGTNLRHLDIIVAIARKRGLNLLERN